MPYKNTPYKIFTPPPLLLEEGWAYCFAHVNRLLYMLISRIFNALMNTCMIV